ncbi:MAG TPA: hypothetical protein PLX88_01165 [Syntrophorhabdaceae bacterium]|jgi:LAO/AO transport system kinase|nr:hypothetical protein [Syntrophorhabdaceae bacterium]MDI9561876.1 hypothetical protein [Pseudomonadota bacterium]OQC50883.1 MAG: hypothetical protein BWX58_00440 [Deltaproteobacteria bacterium ADurb.Bin026]MBP8697623.1 hypothetical protein [Syntrophorhabdaceae bacterium]MBV6505445.1 hypothetical protein [Syntrophorhabdaceae bacterium]
MENEILIQKIQLNVKDGKISCRQALKIAEEENVPSKKIGELINELKIKIMGCQLGCFP